MGVIIPVLTLVFLLFTTVSDANSKARMILVGGSVGSWKVPDSPNNTLNHWSEKTRFKVGDFLVFKYDMKVDSVLQVTREDYESCNTAKPLKQYKDGDTKIELEKSGPYFFISGAPGNCLKGEKMTVVVLSERKPGGGGCGDSPKGSPVSPPTTAPAPAPGPAQNGAVDLKVGSGLLLILIVIGLVMA